MKLTYPLGIWLAAAVGCGSVSTSAFDAGQEGEGDEDASGQGQESDASVDAATHGEVTVTVIRGADPVPDATVIYHEADGAPIDKLLTDETGSVTIEEMPVGGIVTVARDLDGRVLESVAGVKPGDELVFGVLTASLAPFPSSLGAIQVTFPDDAADSYEVQSNCRLGSVPTGGPGETVALDVRDTCPDPENVQVVIYGSTSGTRALTNSATSSPGSDLTFLSTEAVARVRVDAPAVPVTTSADYQLVPLLEPSGFIDLLSATLPLSSGAPTSQTFRLKAGMVPRLRTEVEFEHPDGTASHELVRVDELTAAAGNQQVLDATDHFPFFSSVTPMGGTDPISVGFDAPAALECGSLGAADTLMFTVRGVLGDNSTYSWQLMVPGDVSSPVSLPRLEQADEDQFWPVETFVDHRAAVRAAAFSAMDYDQVRNEAANGLVLGAHLLEPGEVLCTSVGFDEP